MRKHFDRTRVGEGRLNKPSQVEKGRVVDYVGMEEGAHTYLVKPERKATSGYWHILVIVIVQVLVE